MTFTEICEIEPRIFALYRLAKSAIDDKRRRAFCANNIWYDYMKPRLIWLVGSQARNERLRDWQIESMVVDTIYEALPDCRKCGCV